MSESTNGRHPFPEADGNEDKTDKVTEHLLEKILVFSITKDDINKRIGVRQR